MIYDYLVVGAGMFGSVFAQMMHQHGFKVLVIDKRNHVGGNAYTKEVQGIQVHVYGPHIFHTSNQEVWDYVNRFSTFNRFVNSPLANYKGELYHLPFNMNTFYDLWKVVTPEQAKKKIAEQQKKHLYENPKNLEEQALQLVGKEIYEKLIKGYTEKQWGLSCTELPASIIQRLPVRFTFDNNYFNDLYQGIPIGGYTQMIERMLEGIEIRLNTDYLVHQSLCDSLATKVVYTGPIDAFYQYEEGTLEYRSLKFEHQMLDIDNFQGNAVVNYTEKEVPYTRIIEHKHFDFGKQDHTVITKEYPYPWIQGNEAYYPVNNQKNQAIYKKYLERTKSESKYIFGGRLATYQYLDMHHVILSAMNKVKEELSNHSFKHQ